VRSEHVQLVRKRPYFMGDAVDVVLLLRRKGRALEDGQVVVLLVELGPPV
jgi:hypothetical protein